MQLATKDGVFAISVSVTRTKKNTKFIAVRGVAKICLGRYKSFFLGGGVQTLILIVE